MTKPFARVRAAAIDGRLANIYKRQTELERLHKILVQNSQAIKDAIIQDTGSSAVEAAIEYHLAIASLKRQYAQLDPSKELEEEYSIAHGKDAPKRRVVRGIAYITPTSHTLFFSVIAPLAAAVAAGNCVVVQLESTLRTLPGLLRKLLRAALDTDIIDISTSKPEDAQFLAECSEVLQLGAQQPLKLNQIVSPAQERVIAVVDRTANLETAAQALVTARFSFGGTSPYAPDIVLVNEFVKKQFLDAVVRQAIRFLTGESIIANGFVNGSAVTGETSGPKTRTKVVRTFLDEIEKDGSGRVVTSGSTRAIVEMEKRNSAILRRKITECCLCVHAVTSLDDAIDLANSTGTLLATYTFANLPSCKYLAQFIDARIAFANYIPTELLVGPAVPISDTVNLSLRYPSTLFTVPRPQYVNATADSAALSRALRSGSSKDLQHLSTTLGGEGLKVKKRPLAYGIGFFEQGIMLGLGMAATPILAGIGVLGWYGVKTVAARER